MTIEQLIGVLATAQQKCGNIEVRIGLPAMVDGMVESIGCRCASVVHHRESGDVFLVLMHQVYPQSRAPLTVVGTQGQA